MAIRTDMAAEARRLWQKSVQDTTELPGVAAEKQVYCGISADVIRITDSEGAAQLGKPVGKYITMDLSCFMRKERGAFRKTAKAMGKHLTSLLPECKCALIACLGNQCIAADAVGPETLKKTVVTRHLKEYAVPVFENFCSVCAVAPGVLGKTGIESLELVLGAVKKIKPDCVIAVDALASCEPDRLCMSVQMTDTGIMPGSGIGNHRLGFTHETLGVPVVAIGVPTIVDGATFLHLHGHEHSKVPTDLVMTIRDIDIRVKELGALIGYGIDLALHPQLGVDDIPGFLS